MTARRGCFAQSLANRGSRFQGCTLGIQSRRAFSALSIYLSICALLFFFALEQTGECQEQAFHQLKGIVVDANGRPISGAAVTFLGQVSGAVRTSTDGSFILYGLPFGQYTFKVSAEGYRESPPHVTGYYNDFAPPLQVRLEREEMVEKSPEPTPPEKAPVIAYVGDDGTIVNALAGSFSFYSFTDRIHIVLPANIHLTSQTTPSQEKSWKDSLPSLNTKEIFLREGKTTLNFSVGPEGSHNARKFSHHLYYSRSGGLVKNLKDGRNVLSCLISGSGGGMLEYRGTLRAIFDEGALAEDTMVNLIATDYLDPGMRLPTNYARISEIFYLFPQEVSLRTPVRLSYSYDNGEAKGSVSLLYVDPSVNTWRDSPCETSEGFKMLRARLKVLTLFCFASKKT